MLWHKNFTKDFIKANQIEVKDKIKEVKSYLHRVFSKQIKQDVVEFS